MAITRKEKEEYAAFAKEALSKKLKDGSNLFMVLTKTSSTGMSRNIRVFLRTDIVNDYDRGIEDISTEVADLCHDVTRKTKDMEVQVSGCGMDMGYWLAEAIGKRLGLKLNRIWL